MRFRGVLPARLECPETIGPHLTACGGVPIPCARIRRLQGELELPLAIPRFAQELADLMDGCGHRVWLNPRLH